MSCRQIVAEELIVLHESAPDENKQHKRTVFERTVARYENVVRSHLVQGTSESISKRKSVNDDRKSKFMRFAGDIRLPALNHCENGCCVNSDGVFDRSILRGKCLYCHHDIRRPW